MSDSGTVLLVDDEPLLLETLATIVRHLGLTVLTACDGLEALAVAATHQPDLILLDVMLPGLNGFAVCQRLRADPLLAAVPIVLLTALGDRESRLQGISAGADDFIEKPYDTLELQARIRTILRLNRYRRLLDEQTQRLAAEREMTLLRAADALKNRFVSDVSHELRTPLGVLTLTLGNLENRYQQFSDARRMELIQLLRRQTRALNALVDQILDVARLDAPDPDPVREPCDLVQLLRAEAARLLPLAEQRGQRLAGSGPESLPVCADPQQLRQVLANLLANAIKYTPERGQISWECRMLIQPGEARVGWPGSAALAAGTWAAVRVVDSGVGIDPAALPRIFERFYRAASQSAIPGTGLGLAIVREIVDRHAGSVAVESVVGQGSQFAVYLPLDETELLYG